MSDLKFDLTFTDNPPPHDLPALEEGDVQRGPRGALRHLSLELSSSRALSFSLPLSLLSSARLLFFLFPLAELREAADLHGREFDPPERPAHRPGSHVLEPDRKRVLDWGRVGEQRRSSFLFFFFFSGCSTDGVLHEEKKH